MPNTTDLKRSAEASVFFTMVWLAYVIADAKGLKSLLEPFAMGAVFFIIVAFGSTFLRKLQE